MVTAATVPEEKPKEAEEKLKADKKPEGILCRREAPAVVVEVVAAVVPCPISQRRKSDWDRRTCDHPEDEASPHGGSQPVATFTGKDAIEQLGPKTYHLREPEPS